MRFLVTYGAVTRAVTVKDKSSLLSTSKEAFVNLNECALEYKDDVYDLYVRVDDPADVPDGALLRLVDSDPDESVRSGQVISQADTVVVTPGSLDALSTFSIPGASSPSNPSAPEISNAHLL